MTTRTNFTKGDRVFIWTQAIDMFGRRHLCIREGTVVAFIPEWAVVQLKPARPLSRPTWVSVADVLPIDTQQATT